MSNNAGWLLATPMLAAHAESLQMGWLHSGSTPPYLAPVLALPRSFHCEAGQSTADDAADQAAQRQAQQTRME